MTDVFHLTSGHCVLDVMPVGATVMLTQNPPTSMCNSCGSDVGDPIILATLAGHVEVNGTVYDAFERMNPVVCPGCGNTLEHMYWQCGKHGHALSEELFSFLEKPKNE